MDISFLWSNDLINVSVIAWVSAQLIKAVVDTVKHKQFDRHRLAGAGGMPSSHSAVTCAVLLTSYYLYGFNSSPLPWPSWWPYRHVRRHQCPPAAGEQAKVLNYVREHWADLPEEFQGKKLNEHLGHTLPQVIMGALLGTAIGLVGPMIW